MALTAVTETGHGPEFLLSEAPGNRSRDNVVIDASQTLLAGTVLGKKTTGSVTVTPGAVVSGSGGTPGNGSIGTVTADDLAPAGTYIVRILNPASNAGSFEVIKPDGSIDGNGTVAVAYNGTINFTLADGGTDFVEDDRIPVVVSYADGNGRYVMHDPEAVNGAQNAVAILCADVTTGDGETAKAVVISRDAEVISARLVWDDQSGGEKTTALAQLAALGIIAR